MCQSDVTDWKKIHRELSRVANARAQLDHEEARWLMAGLRAEVHRHLGFGSYSEYLERLFGYRPREARERLRVARALEALPQTSGALSQGTLSWSAVREVTRVATGETEGAWLAATANCSVRQVEMMVAGRTVGDLPDTPANDEARRHTLRFDVSAETYALWRDAEAMMRKQSDEPLSEDELLLNVARQLLAGPKNEGRSSYQIAVTVCERCGTAKQRGRGAQLAVSQDVAEAAACDAQKLPATHVGRATQTIPPAVRREVLRRDSKCCVVDGCRAAVFVDVHHLDPRAEGGGHDPNRLVTLCGAHHRAVHSGKLSIEGSVGSLRFTHADGQPYGSAAVKPQAAENGSTVLSALRHLGFKATQAREALSHAMTHVGREASTEALLRSALNHAAPAT